MSVSAKHRWGEGVKRNVPYRPCRRPKLCVLAPHMWGGRVVLRPLQSPAKLVKGENLILMVIVAVFLCIAYGNGTFNC